MAEGEKAAVVLASEARALEIVNMRRAEADGVKLVADAQVRARCQFFGRFFSLSLLIPGDCH